MAVERGDRGRGLYYAPSPPPQTGGEAALRNWCEREYSRIRDAMIEGRSEFLRLDVLQKLPAKPIEGMVGHFAAGVAGEAAGVYSYVGGAWTKL